MKKDYKTIVAYTEWCAKLGLNPSHIENVFKYQDHIKLALAVKGV